MAPTGFVRILLFVRGREKIADYGSSRAPTPTTKEANSRLKSEDFNVCENNAFVWVFVRTRRGRRLDVPCGTTPFLQTSRLPAFSWLPPGGSWRNAPEGECATMRIALVIDERKRERAAGSFHHFAVPLPLGGRQGACANNAVVQIGRAHV